jgi:hypothetical protein
VEATLEHLLFRPPPLVRARQFEMLVLILHAVPLTAPDTAALVTTDNFVVSCFPGGFGVTFQIVYGDTY